MPPQEMTSGQGSKEVRERARAISVGEVVQEEGAGKSGVSKGELGGS